jgi:hypothetical protein
VPGSGTWLRLNCGGAAMLNRKDCLVRRKQRELLKYTGCGKGNEELNHSKYKDKLKI